MKEESNLSSTENKPVLKTDEVVFRSAENDADKLRSRSGTWGSAIGSKQKELIKKTPTRKEKETRRSSDDRRQKRGKCFAHNDLTNRRFNPRDLHVLLRYLHLFFV